jgi:hypothetical protein
VPSLPQTPTKKQFMIASATNNRTINIFFYITVKLGLSDTEDKIKAEGV